MITTKMYGYIYRITDLTNGKCYIGQHKYDKPELDPYYKGSGIITNKLWKKRPETLLMEYIMTCATPEELNYFETYFIEHMNTMVPNGYNLNTGGDHYKASEETRRKMRENHPDFSGENHPMYGKTPWNKGKPRSEETKQKIREALKGKPSPNKDKPKSEEHKRKLSEALKGRHLSEEARRKMSKAKKGENNPMYGKPRSKETRRKMCEANKGRHWYNDSVIEVFKKECPPGFVSGRLKYIK